MTKISIKLQDYKDNIEAANKSVQDLDKKKLKTQNFEKTNTKPFKSMISLISDLDHLVKQYIIVLNDDIKKYKKTEETLVDQDDSIANKIGGNQFGQN
ncbi:hypothetical protein [Xylocopilactobacillus apicola]|uniref:Type VII secretion effector, SACOL2603 family n=1 Tax=Xylocopilactobacillus apicola TaxID=2932184 RepID=A0AAU9DZ06_9LACO|nr:hypothetical protein [Xylocopilactobacillus apicola]BDR59463.1 hypothetical protein XA3_19040 [Xylocopilactobacillus apicola]